MNSNLSKHDFRRFMQKIAHLVSLDSNEYEVLLTNKNNEILSSRAFGEEGFPGKVRKNFREINFKIEVIVKKNVKRVGKKKSLGSSIQKPRKSVEPVVIDKIPNKYNSLQVKKVFGRKEIEKEIVASKEIVKESKRKSRDSSRESSRDRDLPRPSIKRKIIPPPYLLTNPILTKTPSGKRVISSAPSLRNPCEFQYPNDPHILQLDLTARQLEDLDNLLEK